MMKMGEFERRIAQNEGNGKVIHSNLLRDWLKEATEEWLDIEEAELPLKKNGKVDWESTVKIMALRNLIRLKWFKKWLVLEKDECEPDEESLKKF